MEVWGATSLAPINCKLLKPKVILVICTTIIQLSQPNTNIIEEIKKD